MTIGPSLDLASSPRSARDLPRPVARFRAEAMKDGQAVVETVLIETTAWMRRPGMPRMPLEIRMAHRLGREFVHDIRIGPGRLSFRFGLDAYVDGHGLMKVGPSVQTGVEFDQGALIALWGEGLGFPSAWENREDVRWEALDADTARLVVPGPEGDIPIIVAFDPQTGFPVRCEAQRYKSKGPKIGWTGHLSEWRRFAGVLAPGPVQGPMGRRTMALDRHPDHVPHGKRAGRRRDRPRSGGAYRCGPRGGRSHLGMNQNKSPRRMERCRREQ
jgi:hypothetical protein